MIALNNGNIMRSAQCVEPVSGIVDFIGQCQIDQIASNRDMARHLGLQVIDHTIENGRGQHALAIAPPIDIAKDALVSELAQGRAWQWSKVKVGNMGKTKHKKSGLSVE